jgi:hypothetical protein
MTNPPLPADIARCAGAGAAVCERCRRREPGGRVLMATPTPHFGPPEKACFCDYVIFRPWSFDEPDEPAAG